MNEQDTRITFGRRKTNAEGSWREEKGKKKGGRREEETKGDAEEINPFKVKFGRNREKRGDGKKGNPFQAMDNGAKNPSVKWPKSNFAMQESWRGNHSNNNNTAFQTKSKQSLTRSRSEKTSDDSSGPIHLDQAQDLIGLCKEFCPAAEIAERTQFDEIHTLEKPSNDASHSGVPVKKFQRSAADHKLNIPELVRPPDVLLSTTYHILDTIVDKDQEGFDPRYGNIPDPLDVYLFVWDRTRMIRKDFTLQNFRGGGKYDIKCVTIHEMIARYHITMEYELYDIEEFRSQHSQQNMEQFGMTLKSLNEFYDYGRLLKKKDDNIVLSENEAEFRSYFILLTMDNEEGMNVLQYIKSLDPSIYYSPDVQHVLDVFQARRSKNYVKFFENFKNSSYMNRCLMIKYVASTRRNALQIMSKSYGGSTTEVYLFSDLNDLLCFESNKEAKETCESFGLEISEEGVLFRSSVFVDPEKKVVPYKMIKWIDCAPRSELRRDICKGMQEGKAVLAPRKIKVPELKVKKTAQSVPKPIAPKVEKKEIPPQRKEVPQRLSYRAALTKTSTVDARVELTPRSSRIPPQEVYPSFSTSVSKTKRRRDEDPADEDLKRDIKHRTSFGGDDIGRGKRQLTTPDDAKKSFDEGLSAGERKLQEEKRIEEIQRRQREREIIQKQRDEQERLEKIRRAQNELRLEERRKQIEAQRRREMEAKALEEEKRNQRIQRDLYIQQKRIRCDKLRSLRKTREMKIMHTSFTIWRNTFRRAKAVKDTRLRRQDRLLDDMLSLGSGMSQVRMQKAIAVQGSTLRDGGRLKERSTVPRIPKVSVARILANVHPSSLPFQSRKRPRLWDQKSIFWKLVFLTTQPSNPLSCSIVASLSHGGTPPLPHRDSVTAKYLSLYRATVEDPDRVERENLETCVCIKGLEVKESHLSHEDEEFVREEMNGAKALIYFLDTRGVKEIQRNFQTLRVIIDQFHASNESDEIPLVVLYAVEKTEEDLADALLGFKHPALSWIRFIKVADANKDKSIGQWQKAVNESVLLLGAHSPPDPRVLYYTFLDLIQDYMSRSLLGVTLKECVMHANRVLEEISFHLREGMKISWPVPDFSNSSRCVEHGALDGFDGKRTMLRTDWNDGNMITYWEGILNSLRLPVPMDSEAIQEYLKRCIPGYFSSRYRMNPACYITEGYKGWRDEIEVVQILIEERVNDLDCGETGLYLVNDSEDVVPLKLRGKTETVTPRAKENPMNPPKLHSRNISKGVPLSTQTRASFSSSLSTRLSTELTASASWTARLESYCSSPPFRTPLSSPVSMDDSLSSLVSREQDAAYDFLSYLRNVI